MGLVEWVWRLLLALATLVPGTSAVSHAGTEIRHDGLGAHPPLSAAPRVSNQPSPSLKRRGLASTYGPGFRGFLALPEGPGRLVTICGPGACVTATSNDAGPALYMQRRGRIADLDVAMFEKVCGASWRTGLCPVTVTYR